MRSPWPKGYGKGVDLRDLMEALVDDGHLLFQGSFMCIQR